MTSLRKKKHEYPVEVKKQVGQWLKVAPRGSRRIVAQALDVSDRTLRSWQLGLEEEKVKGRRPNAKKWSELILIGREWRRQGFTGSRPIIQALPGIRVRLIREVVAQLKKKRKNRANWKLRKVRIRIDVKEAGTVAAMDGATVRRGEDLIVVRDRGSLSIKINECGSSLSSKNTLEMLQEMKQKDEIPLVLCTDNGSPFCANTVKAFLEKHQVIHLRSLPHVPQHNGSAESAVKEVKELAKSGLKLLDIIKILNQRRKRRQLNWKTADEFYSENYIAYNRETREQFYAATKLAIKEAMLGTKNGYERRKAEREAILTTMERFKLITITRGGQTCA